MPPDLTYLRSTTLRHEGDCLLLGASDDGTVYVEELYEDGWLAQHVLSPDGAILNSVDEDFGTCSPARPLPLPDTLARPQQGWHTAALNFAGPRWRGLRGPERVADLVQPLAIQDKMRVVTEMGLSIAPPQLLGLAESFVLAEAPLCPPDEYIVCRRARLAYALPTICYDSDDQPYDYDTLVIYVAHRVEHGQASAGLLPEPGTGLPGVRLHRPMDCLIRNDWLVIADGGSAGQAARVHVWRVTHEPASEMARQDRKSSIQPEDP